jgi:ribulose-phosphate 3-epimerase
MNPYIIAPSMIASDFTRIADEAAACESAGARWLHVDVMDGHFVPTITVGPLFVESLRRITKLPLDVHLMIENPEKHVEAFAKAGANHIIVHVEACADLGKVIGQIKSLGCEAGVTLRPATPLSTIELVLSQVDLVLVMSVNPGYSGQSFMPEMIERVREVRSKLDVLGSKAHLEVDGGMSLTTIPLVKAAGANAFVTGNAAFKHPKGSAAGVGELVQCANSN